MHSVLTMCQMSRMDIAHRHRSYRFQHFLKGNRLTDRPVPRPGPAASITGFNFHTIQCWYWATSSGRNKSNERAGRERGARSKPEDGDYRYASPRPSAELKILYFNKKNNKTHCIIIQNTLYSSYPRLMYAGDHKTSFWLRKHGSIKCFKTLAKVMVFRTDRVLCVA